MHDGDLIQYSLTHALNLLQWNQFLQLGDNTDDKIIEETIASQNPEDCASLIYTVILDAHTNTDALP